MLYLRAELLNKAGDKAEKPKTSAESGKPVPGKASGGTGEQRGGAYHARAQTGYEKDGSPKYRYFKTEEEYETYLENKNRSESSRKLEHKVKREHEDSTDKHTGQVIHQPASKKPGLLAATKKSLALYVRSI